jgi:hypothetical protein
VIEWGHSQDKRSPHAEEKRRLGSLGLGLVLPATAQAKWLTAAPAEPAKVLVVTSTRDALSVAGVAAIQSDAASGNYAVTAPASASTTTP